MFFLERRLVYYIKKDTSRENRLHSRTKQAKTIELYNYVFSLNIFTDC